MLIVGHRGARHEAPENTLNSFVHAYDHGCRRFELDIQLSSDQHLMVFHDTSLKRTTGKRGRLVDFDSDYLKQLDARNNTPGWGSVCPIPSLNEILDALPQVDHWQFEVKPDSRYRLGVITRELSRLIDLYGLHQRATITSSSTWILRTLQSLHPSISTGLVYESRLGNPVKRALALDCDYLCLDKKLVTKKRITNAQNLGMHVSVWTVNDLEEMEKLKALGVDSIITDHPSMAIRRFEAR